MPYDTSTALPSADSKPAATMDIWKRQKDSLQRWCESEEFWRSQSPPNCLRYGTGESDFISRDVLRTLLASIPTISNAEQHRARPLLPACGDLDCNTCELG